MATEFWSPARVIFGPFVFLFQFVLLVSLEYWQNGLYKWSNEVIQQIWSEKISFDSVLTKSENPRWPPWKPKMTPLWRHVTSQLRYDSSTKFISRRLIIGVSFTSISSIVFKKWRGEGGLMPPPSTPVQGRTKKPSLNRVKFVLKKSVAQWTIFWIIIEVFAIHS